MPLHLSHYMGVSIFVVRSAFITPFPFLVVRSALLVSLLCNLIGELYDTAIGFWLTIQSNKTFGLSLTIKVVFLKLNVTTQVFYLSGVMRWIISNNCWAGKNQKQLTLNGGCVAWQQREESETCDGSDVYNLYSIPKGSIWFEMASLFTSTGTPWLGSWSWNPYAELEELCSTPSPPTHRVARQRSLCFP